MISNIDDRGLVVLVLSTYRTKYNSLGNSANYNNGCIRGSSTNLNRFASQTIMWGNRCLYCLFLRIFILRNF